MSVSDIYNACGTKLIVQSSVYLHFRETGSSLKRHCTTLLLPKEYMDGSCMLAFRSHALDYASYSVEPGMYVHVYSASCNHNMLT